MEDAKRYFAIAELAKEFDVSKRHIRFCEEKGLITPKVTKLNRRIYSRYDRARLNLIFHCVLIGYSQDQIVELIGMPDADLDEADQIKKGLAYAETMIEELETRRNKLSFHQRTSVINEIKMLGDYIKEVKAIPLEILEISLAKPHIPDKESKDKRHKAVEETKPGVERKPWRQLARMAPLYIAGLAIVLIIGGFFYYQISKKDGESIYLPQKEPAKKETQPVYHNRVPMDNTGKQKDLNPIFPDSAAAEKAAAEKAAAEKAAAEKAAAEKAAAEKAAAEKAAAEKAAVEKAAAEKAAVEKSTPFTEQEEDKEMLAHGGKILAEQDRKDRLESFLNIYCQTYASKDLDKFATLFTPDATENNSPFLDMLPNYRKNLENIQSFNYRIELIAYSLQADTGTIMIQGKYFTRFLLHEGTWRENSGDISMELIEHGDSYLVKRLIYSQ